LNPRRGCPLTRFRVLRATVHHRPPAFMTCTDRRPAVASEPPRTRVNETKTEPTSRPSTRVIDAGDRSERQHPPGFGPCQRAAQLVAVHTGADPGLARPGSCAWPGSQPSSACEFGGVGPGLPRQIGWHRSIPPAVADTELTRGSHSGLRLACQPGAKGQLPEEGHGPSRRGRVLDGRYHRPRRWVWQVRVGAGPPRGGCWPMARQPGADQDCLADEHQGCLLPGTGYSRAARARSDCPVACRPRWRLAG
jgi:hypothetical protein